MDLKFNDRPLHTPASACTPVSIIKNKRLKQPQRIEDSEVVIQFFTPAPENKENNSTPLVNKQGSSGIFMPKSFHNTGFLPRHSTLSEKKVEDPNV